MTALAEKMAAAGISPNSLGGPGSILCSFPAPTQTNYGYLVFIEFFVDSFIVSNASGIMLALKNTNRNKGIVIWSVLDPANPFVSPQTAPFVIGLAYADMIWGFANVTISTNLARDLGTRFVAAIFYGRGKQSYNMDTQHYPPTMKLVLSTRRCLRQLFRDIHTSQYPSDNIRHRGL
jgi:glycerol uptake facilitator-like aquaporin